MNDQDWFKKFRPHKGGGCTVVLLQAVWLPGTLLGLLGLLALSLP